MRRKLLLLLVLFVSGIMVAAAQSYTTRRGPDGKTIRLATDSIVAPQSPLMRAGKFLEQSGKYQTIALPALVLSAASFSGEVFGDRATSNTFGCAFGAVFFVAELFDISYRMSAGSVLRFTGTGVQVTF